MDIKLSPISNKVIAVFVIINMILGIMGVYGKLMGGSILISVCLYVFLATLIGSVVIISREEVYKHSMRYLKKAPYEEYRRIRTEQIRRNKRHHT